MGTGIAEVCARAGITTTLVEVNAPAARSAHARIEESLERAVTRGKIDAATAEDSLASCDVAHDLGAVGGCELVLEAIVEDKQAKLDLFRRLAQVVEEPDAILASNTSSIPIVELGTATGDRADHVLGLHFFNPVPVMPLIEVIPSLLTSEDVAARVRTFAVEQLGKEPIIAPDRAGFTVNALLIPYLLSAIRMFEQGLASAEDIDNGMVKGCAHPMGPLALADLIGLDTVLGVAETLYAEHREALFGPPPLLKRLVSAGLLGRKTGRGLYSYD